jgi:hypothetical protein
MSWRFSNDFPIGDLGRPVFSLESEMSNSEMGALTAEQGGILIRLEGISDYSKRDYWK